MLGLLLLTVCGVCLLIACHLLRVRLRHDAEIFFVDPTTITLATAKKNKTSSKTNWKKIGGMFHIYSRWSWLLRRGACRSHLTDMTLSVKSNRRTNSYQEQFKNEFMGICLDSNLVTREHTMWSSKYLRRARKWESVQTASLIPGCNMLLYILCSSQPKNQPLQSHTLRSNVSKVDGVLLTC